MSRDFHLLHNLCYTENWLEIHAKLKDKKTKKSYIKKLSQTNSYGQLPIHCALWRDCPLQILELFLSKDRSRRKLDFRKRLTEYNVSVFNGFHSNRRLGGEALGGGGVEGDSDYDDVGGGEEDEEDIILSSRGVAGGGRNEYLKNSRVVSSSGSRNNNDDNNDDADIENSDSNNANNEEQPNNKMMKAYIGPELDEYSQDEEEKSEDNDETSTRDSPSLSLPISNNSGRLTPKNPLSVGVAAWDSGRDSNSFSGRLFSDEWNIKLNSYPLKLTCKIEGTSSKKSIIQSVNTTTSTTTTNTNTKSNNNNNYHHVAIDSKISDLNHRLKNITNLPMLKTVDKAGWLPLHFAAHYSTSSAVVQLMIDEYPEALNVKSNNRKNGMTPIEYCKKYNTSQKKLDIVRVLQYGMNKLFAEKQAEELRINIKLCCNYMKNSKGMTEYVLTTSSNNLTNEEFAFMVLDECQSCGWREYGEEIMSYIGVEVEEVGEIVNEFDVKKEKPKTKLCSIS